jgi:IS30 family transposase
MQNSYTKKGQLSQGERKVIEVLRKNGQGKSCREIGNVLKRDHTVISREIERNGTDV